MIEWRYFKALNQENQKKIIVLLNEFLECLVNTDTTEDVDIQDMYCEITHALHLEICELLRGQNK